MHFALDDDQQELARTVRDLIARRAGSVDLRSAIASDAGFDRELWATLCGQIGAAALAIPEEYGGAGFTSFETQVVLEQLGASLTPTPLLGSGVLAAQAILAADNAVLAGELLPALAEGSVAALAWADARGRWRLDGSDVIARQVEGDWQLDGESTLVIDGASADVLVVVARVDDRVGLFTLTPGEGCRITRTPGLDQTLSFAAVSFAGATARPLSLDFADGLARLRRIAVVAVSALQVGAAQACLDRTVAYLKEREQFGRPLGSFQALKHRVADLLVLVETARSISWSAGWTAAHDPAHLTEPAAVAKSWCSEAFETTAAEMVQLHGGIAITWEHDAHLFFKRAHACAQLFGPAHEFRAELLQPAG